MAFFANIPMWFTPFLMIAITAGLVYRYPL
jgi:hypothetical protein